jgi:hypothetical protein
MIKMTKYGIAIGVAMMGVFMLSATNGFLFSIIGGIFVGSALKLARQSGEEGY